MIRIQATLSALIAAGIEQMDTRNSVVCVIFSKQPLTNYGFVLYSMVVYSMVFVFTVLRSFTVLRYHGLCFQYLVPFLHTVTRCILGTGLPGEPRVLVK